MKVGCLEVELVLNKDGRVGNSCSECLFNVCITCPKGCTKTMHYALSNSFIEKQSNEYLKSNINV